MRFGAIEAAPGPEGQAAAVYDNRWKGDRRLEAGRVVVQAVSLPAATPELLSSELCRSGLEHWRSLAATTALPDHRNVDPAAMRALLPYTYLVDVLEGGSDFRYRLIGTNIAAHTPRDNTGSLISQIETQGSQSQLRALYASVVAGRAPRFQRIAYRTRLGMRSWYETIACPMGDGTTESAVTRLIGWAEHFQQPVDSLED
ncbi:MAG: PAS domain-containing protein [Alphaproteobacteria bacterium]|nr:PAS domain-containing protein [Alphaproteobacteria bacterium]